MLAGPSVDRHHFLPRSKGGRETAHVHRVCHRKIHSLWSEAELARDLADPAAIRVRPEMEGFLRWIARKHPEFYARTATAATKHRRRM